ncbi:hypothetical protein ACS0TY_022670 [Phlomoides rotata]
MAASTKEILADLSPVIKLYTDGTVDRPLPSPYVPPSSEDPATGVSSKDSTTTAADSASNPLSLSSIPATSTSYPPNPPLWYSPSSTASPPTALNAAYDDSWTALNWICSHAIDEIEINFQKEDWISNYGDFSRVFVGGDSAGGNIAHNIAMRAGSDPLPGNVKIVGAILSHPEFCGSNPIGNELEENRGENLLHRMWLMAYPSAGGGIDKSVD